MNLLLKLSLLVTILICYLPINQCFAQPAPPPNPHIDELVNALINVSGIPGISIAARRNGDLIYAKGFGYADLERKTKMETTSTIRTASVAKIITATALGKLASAGKITFNDPVHKHVPYAPAAFKNLTIRQLAGHTSGVAHRGVKPAQKRKYFSSIKEVIGLFKNPKVEFPANESYSYSTAGYNLLAAIIEGSSGKKYMRYMQEEIFEPLGMTNTYAENINSPKPIEASQYYFKNHRLLLDKKPLNGSYKLAGAGYRSTPTDLVKMTDAYHNGLIDNQVVNHMFRSNQLNNGTETNVGIGWRNNRDFQNRITVDHAGSWQGARTVVVYYPEEQLSVAIMINARCNISIEETAHIIAQYFLAEDNSIPILVPIDQLINVEINGSEFEKCTGRIQVNDQGDGLLQLSSSKQSLKALPIFKLPTADNYAVVSSFGILYMQWNPNTRKGCIYVYRSLRQNGHDREKPFISFKTQQ